MSRIAQRLGITVAGVKYHVSEILGKLGVASRVEAVAWSRAEAPDRRPWLATPCYSSAKTSPVLGTAAAAATAIVFIGILVWGLTAPAGRGPMPTTHQRTPAPRPRRRGADGEFPTLVASRDIAAGTALTHDMVCMALVDTLIPDFKWDACG